VRHSVGTEEKGDRVEEASGKPRSTLVMAVQRAVSRPYLFMAAVVLLIGTVWLLRLAVEEFLLLDRLVNVYTNEAQVQMRSFALRPAITAEVREVAVEEGQAVQQGQVLLRLAQEDFLAALRQAEAAAAGMAQQIQEMRQEMPLTLARAQQEVARAEALLEAKRRAYLRAQELLLVEQDRIANLLQEHQASAEAARARLRAQETEAQAAEMTLQRTQSLFTDGIVAQDRLDAAQLALERNRARVAEAQEELRQVQGKYPSRDSPYMLRVYEKDLQRLQAEVQEQQAARELARTSLGLAQLGAQRLKVLEAKHQEALAQVEAARLKLAKTVIRSPIDGIVAYRKVEPGEMVEGDPSNPPLLVLHNPRSRWIAANVWESDISRVHLGDEVEIWVDAFKASALWRGKPFAGRVVQINPTTFSEVAGLPPERFFSRRERKIPVVIAIEGDDPGMRAGMLAEVLIIPSSGAPAAARRRK
jgi:membrane fusion protein (multidrug efflux system)